ncbi:MAG: cyclic nucleotide-binding domain-containing protein [Verrucomicrobiae bacterium]|nr:cyclic nucleotide-binding domain-containing protein [Verrucomicrobiae bacterium]
MNLKEISIFGNVLKSREIFAVVSKSELFRDITYWEWRRIESVMHERVYHKEEIVFSQGEEGLGLYVVVSGSIQFTSVIDGVHKEVGRTTAGHAFGELSIIDGRERTLTALALEDSKLVGFFKPDLMRLLEAEPKIAAKFCFRVAELACRRLREGMEKVLKK